MTITLETVLIVVIVLISLNLLFIGFYIFTVLREVRKTVTKAKKIIDDVDETVKEEFSKISAVEKPLQALASIAAAVTGAVKAGGMIKRATTTIMSDAAIDDDDAPKKKRKITVPKFFKKKAKKE